MIQYGNNNRFRVASAIPGRIRIQLHPSLANESVLQECARRISRLAETIHVRVAPDASSIVVTYRANAPVERCEQRIQTIVEETVPALPTKAVAVRERSGRATANRASGRNRIADDPSATVMPVLRNVIRRVPGQTEVLHAMNLVNDRPSGIKPLLISTVAIAVAAMEAVPMAIAAAALALAAVPIAQRAAKGIGRRQLTVDQLDILNIALLATGGHVLVASVVAWLVSLTEVVRGKTVGYARQSIADLLPSDESPISTELRLRIERIYQAELSNSRLQNGAMRTGNMTAYPLFVVAIAMYVLTRDPGVIISILKPRTDYTSGIRLGITVPMLSALILAQEQGVVVTSAACLEKLTLIDVIVLANGAEHARSDEFEPFKEALRQRGVRVLRADGRSKSELRGLLTRLRKEGFGIGVVGDADDLAFGDTDYVRITLGRRTTLDTEGVDVYLTDADLMELVRALDIAWETGKICRQNIGLYGGAAVTNLSTALLGISPPPLSSLINSAVMAAAGASSIRPLIRSGRRGDVRRLPTVVPVRQEQK
jgi:cation transport ATPase